MSEVDEYQAKLKSLKKYIPFLVNMMADLKTKGNRDTQLNKIQSLHDMITDDRKKLKLETLNRCEEVLTNIYIKVNPQIKTKTLTPSSPTQTIEVPDSPQRDVDETPRSPSPEDNDTFLRSYPLPIPHENRSKGSNYDNSRKSHIPKIDIYGAAAFDILLDKAKHESTPSADVPDISKPPISLDDLKNLEDDVQDKIASVHLGYRAIDELEQYKKQLEVQLKVDNVNRTLSPKVSSDINTTVRNKLDLSHIKKSKSSKELKFHEKSPKSDKDSTNFATKVHEALDEIISSGRSTPTVASKISIVSYSPSYTPPRKDEQESKKVSRDSKSDKSKEKSKSNEKNDKERERSKNRKSDYRDKDRKRDDRTNRRDYSKDRDKKSSNYKDEQKKREDDKKKPILNRENVNVDLKSRLYGSGSLKTDETSLNSNTPISKDKIEESKEAQIVSKPRLSFEEQLTAPEQQKSFKRLADKYNPKPKKPVPDDFDKLVSKSIEKSMKTSPAKVPDIIEKLSENVNTLEIPTLNARMQEPIPPPASLVRLTMDNPPDEFEKPPAPVHLPEILQKIFEKANKPPPPEPPKPRTDPRIENKKVPADPRRRNEVSKPPLLSRDPISQMEMVPPPPPPLFSMTIDTPRLSPARNVPPVLSPPQPLNMLSPSHSFIQTNAIHKEGLLPIPKPGLLPNPMSRFQPSNLNYPPASGTLDFVPPSPMVDFSCPSPRVDFEIPPSPLFEVQQRPIPSDFLENPIRPPFKNVNFLSKEQFPNEKVTQPMFGGSGNSVDHASKYDLHLLNKYELHSQPMNFYQVNNYSNFGMPVLQPEVPHLMTEPKPYLIESPYQPSWGDSMRQQRPWRDDRRPTNPRNYREYRERKEREERERRERDDYERRERDRQRETEAEKSVSRDPRGRSGDRSRGQERDSARSKSTGRDESKDRVLKATERENPSTTVAKSKFDKMYSTTSRDRSRSRSKSGSEDEVFVSPLDSLYAGKDDKRTGRGYGMQNFRIPKKKKDQPPPKSQEKDKNKEKSTKTQKKQVRRIESDDEENVGDNLSDDEAPPDIDYYSDQETTEIAMTETEKEIFKKTNLTEKKKNKITDKDQQISDDDIPVIKGEAKEARKKKEKVTKAKSKQKMIKPKEEPIIKIEESDPEEVIEIKEEEQVERKKSLRKKAPAKTQSPVVSPIKRQPARKAKKLSVPLPVLVKEESDDDVEEIPPEYDIIDVEDDEETQREIEELEAAQIAESLGRVEKTVTPTSEGATNEELELFVSEYVLEVTGDVQKCFKPIEKQIKQELIYDTENIETSTTKDATIQRGTVVEKNNSKPNKVKPTIKEKSKVTGVKETLSLQKEATKRMQTINQLAKLTKPAVIEQGQPVETEADIAAKELLDLLGPTDQITLTKDNQTDPLTRVSETPEPKTKETTKNVVSSHKDQDNFQTKAKEIPQVSEDLREQGKLETELKEASIEVTQPVSVSREVVNIEAKTAIEKTPALQVSKESVLKEPVMSETEKVSLKEVSQSLPKDLETLPTDSSVSKKHSDIEQLSVKTGDSLPSEAKNKVTDPKASETFSNIEQPSVKTVEVEVQEPTSSQDKQSSDFSPKPNKKLEETENKDSKMSEVNSEDLQKSSKVAKIDEVPTQSSEPETSKKSDGSVEPSEPNILAHFFENLLKSKNKQDKKTALFSLIQTFSDSFTERELNKITKIIRADQEEENSDDDALKKDEIENAPSENENRLRKEESGTIEPEKVKILEEETPVVGSTTEEDVPIAEKLRRRHLSSTTEEENHDCDTSEAKTTEKQSPEVVTMTDTEMIEQYLEEPVLVSVGERIKSRKRNSQPPHNKNKKYKTELDRIHEDIKEMFIRDGVLTANGKRITRMLKEDPNVLTSPTKTSSDEVVKTKQKKPTGKPKLKEHSRHIKDVRIVLSKMPDNKFEIQNRRILRSNRKSSIGESDGATDSNYADESGKSESESPESSESEKEQIEDETKKIQSEVHQPKLKPGKKRIRSSWAMGIIKKKKKPAQVKSKENSPERSTSPDVEDISAIEEDLDKLFVEPDKNYYYDPNDKKKMFCKLCDFSGMFITTHYLKEHPHSEVLCSRFSPDMAKDAKKDYEAKEKRYEGIINKRLALKYNYSCRFCGYTSQTQPIFFYEHCSTHTGEYRHQCGICFFYSVTGKTLNQHFINAHPGEEKNAIRDIYNKAVIYGYICGECNYVQLKEKAVEEHVNIYHLGERPEIYKISMSKILDPALEDCKTNLLVIPSSEKKPAAVKSEKPESKDDSQTTTKTGSEEISSEPKKPVQPQKKIKKVVKKAIKNKETTEESVTDSDVPEQKNELEPPKIRRKPGPKSKTRPLEIVEKPVVVPSEVETETESEEQQIIPPPPVRRKPGPKSKTQRPQRSPIRPVQTSESENHPEQETTTTDSEINKEQNESSASEDQITGPTPARILRKRRSLEALICKENGEDLESVIALSSRSSRAAKEKASKHIKFFIETNEGSPRKLKALANEQAKARKVSESKEKEMDILKPAENDEEKPALKKDDKPKVKKGHKTKETDTNVFTCQSDIAQEDKIIEEERLKKMEELNKSLNTRSSKLDFVEKLSNRLTNADTDIAEPPVTIKEEPKDMDTSFERPETPMPLLEKEVPIRSPVRTPTPAIPKSPAENRSSVKSKTSEPSKRPALEDSSPVTSVNVNLRSNSLFPDIIHKLQGKVSGSQESTSGLSDSNEPSQHIQIGKFLKATKQKDVVVFSCHAANCYVSTKDRMVFQLHCKFGHRDISVGNECMCDACGVNVTTTADTTLMENLYDHLMYAHSDFLETSSKPKVIRMRKLSGDKLSIKREEEEEAQKEIKKEKVDEESEKNPEETPVPMEIEPPNEPTTPVPSEATLEPVADNPFTFKIAEVISLAGTQESPKSQTQTSMQVSPPGVLSVSKQIQLSPQTKNQIQVSPPMQKTWQISPQIQKPIQVVPQMPKQLVTTQVASQPTQSLTQPPPLTLIGSKPTTQHQLVIKEAKLTQAELNKPRKAPKAMTKFIETPGDLYKCPHYYCLFSTNFRAFLERHLKAHKSDTEVMIPCVYCDMKTPWEHVPMHIDIRHAHCKFACAYCLYRSWVKEYVCLHQDHHHPAMDYLVIQLPQHKAAKKFSVADLKNDPKTLCEPFRCCCGDGTNREYLYENEFDQHLKVRHGGSQTTFLRCGYKGCTYKLSLPQIIHHWSLYHGISTYQCGYCKMSSKEILKMYYHFAQFHQCMAPDILVRIGDYVLDPNNELGYSAEAFDRLAHITNLPGNILSVNKSKSAKSIKLILPSTGTQPSATSSTDSLALTVDTVTAPPMTSLANQNIQLIVASGSDTATSNSLYFLPSASDSITLHAAPSAEVTQSSIPKSPTKIVAKSKPTPIIVPSKKPTDLVTLSADRAKATVLQCSTDIERASLRSLMCPNVTVVGSKPQILSKSSSSALTKPISSAKTSTTNAVLPPEITLSYGTSTDIAKHATSSAIEGTKSSEPDVTLPPGISLTKLSQTKKSDKEQVEKEKTAQQMDKDNEALQQPTNPTDERGTPSPILIPEADENSLDEPLFDNIDVNTDSPVNDPLSIEPTISAIAGEHPTDPGEDPLSILTGQDLLSSEAESTISAVSEKTAPPRVRRSVSNISNSDDETEHDKTGLQGYQLYRCAICSISFSNGKDFKQHIVQSTMCRKEGKKPYQCVHCNKLMKTCPRLCSHIQVHGILRFSCSLCSMKFAISHSAKLHMKLRHQINQTTMFAVVPGKTNQENDCFIVRPVSAHTSGGRDSANDSPSKSGGEEMSFLPDQIFEIPIRQIFTQNVKCGLCNYQTKVRVNIVRHLQMHSDDKWVPDTAPVNPVPCLDKNEKMFDKMINLASSSMEGRIGGAKGDKEKDEDKVPEYVPSNSRFICCAQGCSYLCLEESNLRHHIMALHSDELDFNCGHCKIKIESPDVDSVIKHLKLHGLHLYKCKYCSFVHHLKHKVEKHVSDSHSDAAVKVVVVRQMEAEQDPDRSTEIVKEANNSKIRPWRCCFCKYITATEDLIKNHVATKHNLDSQFKCSLCSYKSNEKASFGQHFKDKHPSFGLDIINVYQYFEDETQKEDEIPLDTTPLWQRDKTRIRHIRGILLDESAPQPSKSPKGKGFKPGPSVSKSPNSKNLFDAIDAVARGKNNATGVKTYSKNKKEDDLEYAVNLQDKVVKKILRETADPLRVETQTSDPLKVDDKVVVKTTVDPLALPTTVTVTTTKDSKTIKPLPLTELIVDSTDETLMPVLPTIADEDNDIKDILPTLEEINKVKQGSDDPIIIIDDDDDLEIIPSKPKVEKRGKKRAGGGTDLLQEALKMAKLDEISRTDVDDNGVPINEYTEESLKKIFGEYGAPNNRQWKCPLCLQFRSKRISDFIFHIFKDLNVFRYRCRSCKDESITFKYMIGHIKTHFEPLTEDDIETLPSNTKLEAWIQMVLREQSLIISNNIQNMSKPVALVDENISCMFCSDRFPNAAEASEHMLKHWITKPYLCMYCPNDYYTRYELRHHQATIHPNLKQVVNNISPTVSEAMSRFDDGFRKRPLVTTNQDFPVAKRMKYQTDEISPDLAADTINIVSVNDILNKGNVMDEPSSSGLQQNNDTINIDSDEDLVLVTKSDDFVPNEDNVYACSLCAFVDDREESVIKHIEKQHGKSQGRYKVLNKKDPDTTNLMGCNICDLVLGELKLRLHFLEHHINCSYSPYIFSCNVCSSKYLSMRSIRYHFTQKHQHHGLDFTTITGYHESTSGTTKNRTRKLKGESMQIKCIYCTYSDGASKMSKMRIHLRERHLKAYECIACLERFPTEAKALSHRSIVHEELDLPVPYKVLDDVVAEFNTAMNAISESAKPVNSAD